MSILAAGHGNFRAPQTFAFAVIAARDAKLFC
jgi:hypothetical protein